MPVSHYILNWFKFPLLSLILMFDNIFQHDFNLCNTFKRAAKTLTFVKQKGNVIESDTGSSPFFETMLSTVKIKQTFLNCKFVLFAVFLKVLFRPVWNANRSINTDKLGWTMKSYHVGVSCSYELKHKWIVLKWQKTKGRWHREETE